MTAAPTLRQLAIPAAAVFVAAGAVAGALLDGPARLAVVALLVLAAAAIAFQFARTIGRQYDTALDIGLRADGGGGETGLRIAEAAALRARLAAAAGEFRAAQRSLRQQLDEAIYANQAKADFLANMSHELRTPLNAIIGFAEFLQIRVGRTLPERERAYLDDIVQAAFHLLSIIQEILDFSRLEAGKLAVQEETTRLADIVDAAVRLVRKQAEAKRIALSENLDAATHLACDPTKIRQICANLVTNAIKFTPAGGRVDVWCGVEEDGRPAVRVADSGVGMTPAEVDLAMKPFMRVATNPFVAKEGGIGLGLPISRALAELHGGEMEIVSRPKHGTSVTVRFPAERRAGL
jgi:two-component system cell cycle sensor histidine kinase PleC